MPHQQVGAANAAAEAVNLQPNHYTHENLEAYNCEKSLLRVTTERIPHSFQLQKESAIPLGIIVKPFGVASSGEEFPAINIGGKPIVRCKECRAYVNPFIRFIDNGMKWICNFCGDVNNTESYYYSPTNKAGVR